MELIVQQLREHLARPNADQLAHHSDVLLGTALVEAALGDTALPNDGLIRSHCLTLNPRLYG
ncbi:hypothetical protein HSBAA_45670 [Vreelandella sulfidaeris]|uniref:Uncharacterized protein n=1 Tax=Vreelandella sulfidaeris TaxID=115553 RepID=A0A455UF27_9GAMM|nr:hypothetical protein HSBAA_45670 [Halomonas sulfidaeris]